MRPGQRSRPPRRRSRLRLALVASLALALAASTAAAWRVAHDGNSCSNALRPLAAKQVARLDEFQAWLKRNHVLGYVGEVGWPGTGRDAAQWNGVAQAWYAEADRDQLWVTAWSAAKGWPRTYPMATYRLSSDPKIRSASGGQARVVEAHTRASAALRGVDLPSGAFGALHDAGGRYSDLSPGVYGRDYYYPTAPEYHFLNERGIHLVRLAFTWERVQPKPFGPLSAAELRHLKQTIYDATSAGIAVIIDLHNFGEYWHASSSAPNPQPSVLGSAQLPTTALADLWRRLALALRGVPGITGYDLMNEPGGLATNPKAGALVWQRASQQAVDAIRSTSDQRMLAIEAYAASGPQEFVQLHPRAWIHDPANLTRYEMHQYFDSDGSGHYRQTLHAEAAAARTELKTDKAMAGVARRLTCVQSTA